MSAISAPQPVPSVAPPAERRLGAARLAGAAGVAILGQFAVHDPQGLFGPADEMTSVGWGFTALTAALAILGTVSAWRRPSWFARVVPLAFAVGIGAFVPALGSDPVPAGFVVVWHGLLLARFLFPPPVGRGRLPPHSPLAIWVEENGAALRHLIGVSLVIAIAVLGFRFGHRIPALLVTLTLGGSVLVASRGFVALLARQESRIPWILGLLLGAAVASVPLPGLALTFLAVIQAVVGLALVARMAIVPELLGTLLRRPAVLLVGSFAGLIGVGTLLLSFPAASSAAPISPLDALFTSTSASCVTGLVVLDTPRDFSLFGQVVILALIQVGGLSIMVLSTFALLVLGRRIGLRAGMALGELLDLGPGTSPWRVVRFVVLSTLGIEAVGAIVLTLVELGQGASVGRALWLGTFHSISAFCNAGFALRSDSLVPLQRSPVTLFVVSLLIVLGGLGFSVLLTGWRRVTDHGGRSLMTQTRIVVRATLALVALGAAWFAVVEWNASLAGLAVDAKLTNAAFQSVTLRTAGFNSVDLTACRPATLVVMMALMFVGASPGGTGGGIKTTTLVVLLAAVAASRRQDAEVELVGRRIPSGVVYRAIAITFVSGLVVLVTATALMASESLPFDALLFEAVSAVGTVGLSLGVTPALSPVGKLVIVAAMLAGRVGPLTVALLLGRREGGRHRFPESRIMVG